MNGGGFRSNRFVRTRVHGAGEDVRAVSAQGHDRGRASDADIVVFDPNAEHTISAKTHHMRVDYSMFEGIRVKGVPKTVLSRGRVVVENGKFLGQPGTGEFIRRQGYSGV